MSTKILATVAALALLGVAVAPVQAQTGTVNVGAGVQGIANVARASHVSYLRAASCALHVGGFVAGNVVAIAKLRKAGGVLKVAKKVLTARGRIGKMEALVAVFGEAIGIEDVVTHC